MRLRKYLSFLRAGLIEMVQYRLSLFIMVVGNLLYLILIYFLWKAIYASAGTDRVNGMTFSDTLIYLVLATAMFTFMEMYAVWEIGRDIQSGKMVLNLLKPMKYRTYLFWSYSGTLVSHFLVTFLPTLIIVRIVTGDAIPLSWNLLLFLVAALMAVVINYSIDFIVGTICIFTESIWGINIMKQVIVLLLSGATIPVAFFPEGLRTVVYFLPFQSIYNTPLTILIGKETPENILWMMGLQLFWCVFLGVASRLFWSRSIRRITVNGG
ncbi:MAG: ABC-2 family transporter protein [Eubacterium sp.]|nr:ABC-2 family transporter protein [Eubacterium sp.]